MMDWFTILLTESLKISILRSENNDVTDQKSPFFYVPSDSYSFFSVGEVVQDLSMQTSDTNIIFNFRIQLDSKYQIIDRKVYSLGDMFGQIGGMDSILVSIGTLFMAVFSPKIYAASLLSTFYQVRNEGFDNKIHSKELVEENKELQLSRLELKFKNPNAVFSNRSLRVFIIKNPLIFTSVLLFTY